MIITISVLIALGSLGLGSPVFYVRSSLLFHIVHTLGLWSGLCCGVHLLGQGFPRGTLPLLGYWRENNTRPIVVDLTVPA